MDIPQSMRHLVYDFGQPSGDTEDDYIVQIVHNHVSVCNIHADKDSDIAHGICALKYGVNTFCII